MNHVSKYFILQSKNILILFLILFSLTIVTIFSGVIENINVLYIIIQFIFIPFPGFVIIFIFKEPFEKEFGYYLQTFFKKNIIKIYTIHCFFYITATLVIMTTVSIKFKEFNLILCFLLAISQIILYSVICLLVLIITKDSILTLTITTLILSIEIVTFGSLKYFIHIFYLNINEIPTFTNISNLIINNFVFSFIFFRIYKMLI